jgi:alkanesulfonate monooxygenase SsuD/methylene tetrahydromethanopterin reductase-like flavin-dependent oxidoreductase (luciferase family)
VPTLYVLPLHDAVKAQDATLDVLSGGRAGVCVGVGGRPNDYRAVSAPFERRHVPHGQQVAAMRRSGMASRRSSADPVGPAPIRSADLPA